MVLVEQNLHNDGATLWFRTKNLKFIFKKILRLLIRAVGREI
jgi:hypothetical protein